MQDYISFDKRTIHMKKVFYEDSRQSSNVRSSGRLHVPKQRRLPPLPLDLAKGGTENRLAELALPPAALHPRSLPRARQQPVSLQTGKKPASRDRIHSRRISRRPAGGSLFPARPRRPLPPSPRRLQRSHDRSGRILHQRLLPGAGRTPRRISRIHRLEPPGMHRRFRLEKI